MQVRATLPVAGPAGPVTLIGWWDITGLYAAALTALARPTVSMPVEGTTSTGLSLIQEAMQDVRQDADARRSA